MPNPPFAIGRMPLISEVKLTKAFDTTPEVALRKPESVPIERFDVNKFVVVAAVVVLFVIDRLDIVDDALPIKSPPKLLKEARGALNESLISKGLQFG
jgi:hypothetical protein